MSLKIFRYSVLPLSESAYQHSSTDSRLSHRCVGEKICKKDGNNKIKIVKKKSENVNKGDVEVIPNKRAV